MGGRDDRAARKMALARLARSLVLVLVLRAVAPCASLQHFTPALRAVGSSRSSRSCTPRMEDLLSTLAPLVAFPPMFFAIQMLAEEGSNKMGDAGLLDIEAKTPEQREADPPKPLLSFLPKPQLPDFLPKPQLPSLPSTPSLPSRYAKDFYAPLPGDSTSGRVYFPLVDDEAAGTYPTE